jgi:threonine/homoserine/homoserine lactone efflux protein
MLMALASGVLLGFSAGLAPGPMLALVLAQTLRHGWREGCKTALTPLVTDPPIILITLMLAAKLSEARLVLGVVSMAGSIFVLFLAWESFSPIRDVTGALPERPRSWSKGIITNLLNPHPWLFWMTVGAALLAKAIAQGWLVATAFLGGFYLLLVGSKVTVALLVGRSRQLLAGRGYRIAMRTLGILLALFALFLFRDGLKQLGITG